MTFMKPLAAAALAVALVSGPALAASEHAHGGHGVSAVELRLNDGQKWPTDEALRKGMSEMRSLLATSLGRIHAGQFTPVDYAGLAERLQQQVDYVTVNCKLPEEADEQLHVVLVEVIEGMEAMKTGAERSEGALRAVAALNAYGRHFDHPDWTPLAR